MIDSYILRIYRRPEASTRRVVGVLETPDGHTRYVFRNIEELWRVLTMESEIDDEAFKNTASSEDDE